MQIILHPTGKTEKFNRTQFKIQQSSENGQQSCLDTKLYQDYYTEN